ncbi:hypothetical protein [Bacillus methanolicus]|nr:hypothetical protein [Bacillus methanolicus]
MRSQLNQLNFWHGLRDSKEEKVEDLLAKQLSEATVNQSGNSDVDVNVKVNIDTMPIALALLCQSFANKQLTKEEFEIAVKKLLELTDKYRESKNEKKSNVKYINKDIWGV